MYFLKVYNCVLLNSCSGVDACFLTQGESVHYFLLSKHNANTMESAFSGNSLINAIYKDGYNWLNRL